MLESWYYLHSNGDLIYKRTWPGEDNSPFVERIWFCDPTDRINAWTICIEALAAGARVSRIKELSAKWGCNARDLVEFLVRAPKPTPEQIKGMRLFLSQIIGIEPDAYFDWLEATPKGKQPDFSTMPKL